MTKTSPLRPWKIHCGCAAAILASTLISAGCRRPQGTVAGPSVKSFDLGAQGDTAKAKKSDEAVVNDVFAPMVQVQDEDYPDARRQFRTKLTRKGPSPQEATPPKPPAEVSEVEYRSGELRLKAWVNRPADAKTRHPAVLFLHGGFAFGPEDWEVSKPYRDAGFVVLTPMLRGENGQPGAYSFYYGEVDDALAAADYLSKLPYVNPDRVFIAGPSAGGTLVLLTAMTSKRFRAAATFSGITDQVLFCKHAKNAARDVPVDLTDLRELQMRSPLAYAGSFKCPARIYYGSQEPHLRPMSQRTAELAQKKGLNVEAIQIEGDHSTSVPPAIRKSIEFFQGNDLPSKPGGM